MIDNFKKYMELILNGHLLHSYYARIQVKIVLWSNGYWLLQKHLTKGTFCWPKTMDEAKATSIDDIERLLDGQDVFRKLNERNERLIH